MAKTSPRRQTQGQDEIYLPKVFFDQKIVWNSDQNLRMCCVLIQRVPTRTVPGVLK